MSQARRLLVGALNRGLEIAGREKGLMGSAEEVATETAAQIAADMIRSGRGDDVLKLLAVAAPKGEEGEGPAGNSPLLDALNRLPGAMGAPQRSQANQDESGKPDNSTSYDQGATDVQSVASGGNTFFSPQPLLFPAGPAVGAVPVDGQGEGNAATPRPPAGGGTPPYGVRAENFEKFEEER